MQCDICSATLTGRQARFCSPLCASRGNYADRVADGRHASYRSSQYAAEYARRRRTGQTGRPLVACAACGGPTGKIAASEPNRRRVCSTLCRTYLQRGEWPTCKVPIRKSREPRPVATPAPMVERSCGWCETTFVSNQPQAWYCSKACSGRAAGVRRRAREAGSHGHWTWSDFMRMARKFNYCCAYCGNKPTRLDPDHVTALSRGGANYIANLLPTCHACNSDKRDLSLDEWAADRERRGLPPRATSWASEDSRYWHLTAVAARAAA